MLFCASFPAGTGPMAPSAHNSTCISRKEESLEERNIAVLGCALDAWGLERVAALYLLVNNLCQCREE